VQRYLSHYYAFLGEYAERVAASAAVSEEQVREQNEAFKAAGCDELIWFPCSPDPEQVELLAAASAD
jgi:hypothetical protein